MNQPTSFPYGQLRGLSFNQLYSLVVAMARGRWIVCREQSLVLRRAWESERMRFLQPASAALFHRDSEDDRATGPGNPRN